MAKLRFPADVEHTLDPKAATTLGSGRDAVIRVEDANVSELHCVVRALQGGGFGLKDLGSESGTFVDGKRVEAVRLKHGARVQLGSVQFEFLERDEATKPAPKPAPKPTPKASTSADADFAPGDRLGGYEIEAVIGHGGMGTVYSATQLSLGRQVAIKVLKAELAADPAFVQRFESEARAAGRFNHPNVVQVFDVDEQDGRPFYSMELLPQGSLEDRLRARGPLSIDDTLQALRDAARGLAYANELGLVHRDIKPDNLMPSSQGRLKICDLGLATDPGGQGKGKILGTPHFLSPEQARGRPVDHKSDVYSLGCSTYRLLTGKNPFPRKTVREILKAHLDAPVPSTREARNECPEVLDALLTRMMAKDPAARPDANEVESEIDAMLEGTTASKGPMLAIVGVLVVLIGVVIYLVSQGDKDPITIVKVDPLAKKALADKKENEAEIARLSVASDLPRAERATALEKVAKEHAGTRAAELATKEAGELRAEIAAAKLKAEQAAAALRERIGRIEALGTQAATDPIAAWRALAKWSGSADPESEFGKAIEAAKAKVDEAWATRAREAYARFETTVGSKDSDLEAALKELEKELVVPPTDAAPAAVATLLRTKVEDGRALITQVARARIEARRARAGELAAARDATLFGDGGVLDLFRRGELDAAKKKLAAIPKAPEGLEELDAPLQRLRGLFDGVTRALDALKTRARSAPIQVQLRGAPVRITDVDGVSCKVLARDDSEIRVVLPDEPALVAELLGPASAATTLTPAARADASLFVMIALADASTAGRRYLASSNGDGATPDFPWAMQQGLQRLTALPDGDALQIEALGLDALGRMMRAIQQKSEVAAAHWAATLEKKAARSLIGQSLGIDGS